MKEKHALIVDDSRSARLVLQRMLKKYGVNAHTVASAEDALDYLLRHRPDVIFMDHLMPGMDGFEAVKHIKKNLDTATIPIIMFTSQSGELYLSQARALGAVDILPKATASTELYESLRRLGLLKKTVETVEIDVSENAADSEKSIGRSIRALTSDFLRPNKKSDTDEKVITELKFLRGYLSEQTETQQQNLQASLRLYSGKLYKSFAEKLEEKIQLLQTSQVKPEKRSDFPLLLLLLLLFISLFWNYSLQNKIIDIEIAANSAVNEDTVKSMLNELSVQQRSRVDTDIPESSHNWNLAEWAVNQNLIFPYNELALGRQRLIQIRKLLKIAEAAGFKGKIVLQTHIGEFCLRGNVEEGYQLAAADLPLNRCNEIINPAQSSDLVSMQQSVEFANFLAMATTDYRSIKLEVINLPREQSLYEYPSTTADVTAGQWNRIAQMNNRIVAKLVAE